MSTASAYLRSSISVALRGILFITIVRRRTADRVRWHAFDVSERSGGDWNHHGEAGVLRRGTRMFPKNERVEILKSVRIFAETPPSVLAEIAPLMKELFVDTDEVILRKGELGDCLYIIIDGRVRIHDGPHPLAVLGEGEIFGELAVLDPEPRSASATAVAPGRLFRLDQGAFYALMADRIEIVRSILRVLCQRLRDLNAALVDATG